MTEVEKRATDLAIALKSFIQVCSNIQENYSHVDVYDKISMVNAAKSQIAMQYGVSEKDLIMGLNGLMKHEKQQNKTS